MLKRRLEKLEQSFKQIRENRRVYFANQDTINSRMVIPDLNFSGTSYEGRQLMEQYPQCTFIIDDIGRFDHVQESFSQVGANR